MSKNELSVRLCEKPIGNLYRSGANMRFTYGQSARRPLSLSMPLEKNAYGNKYCESFFGGLLPESTKARTIIGRLFHVNSNNSFNLLAAIGYDCAGAVSIQNIDDPVASSNIHKVAGQALSEKALSNYLHELPKRPLLAHLDEIRISLAGVQDKAALCVIDEQICLPEGNTPSTHILKPAIRELEGSVENEFFCLKLAQAIGLPAAKVEIRRALDNIYLLVERYDRVFIDSRKLKRVHQEDFCQASGIVSTSKYQTDGGPSLKNCFDLLNNATFPAVGRKQLLDIVIFNFLVGNADAHAKNFAFLYPEDGTIKLAPAYDILCTRIYKQTTNKMAMSIGGEYQFEKIRASHWQKFCEQNKLSFSGFKQRSGEIIESINKVAKEENKNLIDLGFTSDTVKEVVDYIQISTKSFLDQFDKSSEF
jgi:serine/threonine-protein kinase HipA